MNLAAYRTAIAERIGTTYSTTALNRDINFALQEIAAEYAWGWLEASATFNSVASQASYSLTTNAPSFVEPISLALTATGEMLDSIALPDVDSYLWNDSLTYSFGNGRYYAISGDNLIILPTPADVRSYTLRYRKTETVLAADGDVPLIPSVYDQAVVDLASYTVLNRSADPSDMKRADRFFANYSRLLKKMRPLGKRSGPLLPRIRPGSSW